MSNGNKCTVCSVLLATCAVVAPAQTVQKVIDEFLQAQGGKKALAQIRTETLAGSLIEESSGQTGSWSLITKAPNRFYLEITAGPDRVLEAYNGMSAWGQNSPEAAGTLTGEAAKEAEASGRYWNNRFADPDKSRLIVQMVGVEKVGRRDAYHVQAQPGPGITREVFFDAQTHLIAREARAGEQIDYDDYRPVNGIQMPFRLEVHRGSHTYKISVTRAEINAPVDDSVFDFPKARGTKLPDIADLIREVSRNQKAVDEMQKEYTCHLTVEQDETGSKGARIMRIREFEVFNIAGDEVRHLIAKDGAPLSGKEKKKEDERFEKEFQERTKEAARLAANPKKQAKQEAEDDAQISDFLRAERFSNPRRERFRGEDVIAVDFGPNPDYKPKKAIENYLQKLTGVVLIDDEAHDVARLEAHVDNSIKVGGGVLASLDKGSSFVFEQGRINDEVWLPSYAEVHVAGHALLFLKLKANEIDRYTDYKKFHSDSKLVGTQE
jgi:outer membrane biogenesis lipoprotein LolB